jgi:phosphoribosylaminoimidazole (AIR) synthetase
VVGLCALVKELFTGIADAAWIAAVAFIGGETFVGF